MQLDIKDIQEGQPIPERFAFGIVDIDEPMALGRNLSPELRWSGAPPGSKSFVVMVTDLDAPSSAEDVNQEGKTVAKDLERVAFSHWLLVDIPPDVDHLKEGNDSSEVTVGGKAPFRDGLGQRGVNDYTDFLAANPDMAGTYGGYDGPCPPWNDEIPHRYVFRVLALDVASLGLPENFRGPDLEQALAGHVLDHAQVTATYTLNRALRQD
ncbi:MAG: YbhB/YbcL family Raf kinase inhibitor-like protein [Halomonadaceae bacterium]|nr:MAG: YbhB/YbcL family Raf kinase inhibitor-like protein [Halomonadaceae bacterium]